jgi:hypothetical protein
MHLDACLRWSGTAAALRTIALVLALALPAGGQALAPPAYPLALSADGHHIVDQTGRAVFFNADSPWHILPRLTREDTQLYLDNRQQKGFNAIVVSLVVRDGFPGGTGTNAYGAPPFLVPGDFATPNEAYFAHVDWVLQQANQRGITVFLFPALVGYICSAEGWCQIMQQNGDAKMRDWGRWVGNRYKNQPNIVWVHGGDVDAAAYGALDEVDAVAEGILEMDRNHLHTANCNRFNSALDCYNRPWLDFNTTYGDCTRTPREVITDYQRPTPVPSLYIEGRYEYERDWTDRCLRSQAYWAALGGMTGHCFGSGRIWDFVAGWRTAMGSPGSLSMDIFGRLLRSRPWALLVPDYAHAVLTSGYGDIDTADYASAARASDGSTIVVFTPTQRALTIAMGRITGSTAVAWWFDPVRGVASAAGTFPTTGSRAFTPPTAAEWVLVVDNQAAGFAPPGQGEWQVTGVAPAPARRSFVLEQNHPNPFNPQTTIRYTLAHDGRAVLRIFDATGALVRTLVDVNQAVGEQVVSWDGRTDRGGSAASGVYFYQLEADGSVQARKIVLLR